MPTGKNHREEGQGKQEHNEQEDKQSRTASENLNHDSPKYVGLSHRLVVYILQHYTKHKPFVLTDHNFTQHIAKEKKTFSISSI